MAKITVEAVLKVLEYAALAVYGVVKVCKKETDIKTKKEQLCLKIVYGGPCKNLIKNRAGQL